MATDVGSAVGYLDLDISGFLAGLKTAQSEADSASKNIVTKVGNNLQGIGKTFTTAGATLTKGMTIPIVTAGTAAFKFSSDFETAMAKVSTIADPAVKSIGSMKDEVVKLSDETGVAAKDLAEATYEAISSGINTADAVSFTGKASKLAVSGFTSAASAVDVLTTILNAYGLSAQETTHISDVLIKTQNLGKTTVDELASSMGKVIPTANAFGVSVEQLGTAYSFMTARGIATAESTTYLNGMLNELGKSGTKVSDTLKEKTGKSFQELMGEGYSLRDVLSILQGAAEEAEVGFNDLWSSQEAGKAALSLAGVEVENFNDTLKDFQGAAGDTESAYKKMADTTERKFNVAVQKAKNTISEFGDTIKKVAIPYIEKFGMWIDKLRTWLESLSEKQREQIVKIAAIVAAAGPLLIVLGKIISGVGGMITAFGGIPSMVAKTKAGFTAMTTGLLNIKEGFILAKAGYTGFAAETSVLGTALAGITAPIIAIVAAIGLVIGAFVTLWKTNEEFRNKMLDIFDGIKGKFDSFCKGIVDRLNALGFNFKDITEVIWSIWKGFCDLLAPVFTNTLQFIWSALATVFNVITDILDVFIGLFTGNWKQFWSGIENLVSDIIMGIGWIITDAFNLIKDVTNVFLSWFGTSWEKIWKSVSKFFSDTWNSITSFFSKVANSIKTTASNFISSVVTFFQELPTKISMFITNALTAVSNWATNMVAKANEMGTNFINAVVQFFTDLPYKIGYFISNTLVTVALWVVNMVTKAQEMGTNFINATVEFFTLLPGRIWEFLTQAFINVQTWAADMATKAWEMGTNFINNVITFFAELPGKVYTFITEALNKIQVWATDTATLAYQAGSNFITNVITFLTSLPGKVKGFLDDAINFVKDWVTNMGKKGKEAITTLIDKFVEGAKSIPQTMGDIGKNIVEGVWNGITGAAGWFMDQVTGFFKGIVDGAKNALGIHSPSTVFANQIGKWLPAGAAEGFKKAMPAAAKLIQTSLSKGIDSVEASPIEIGASVKVDTFTDKLQSAYENIAVWFESIETRMENSVQSMIESLNVLIYTGKQIVGFDNEGMGYVGTQGITQKAPANDSYDENKNPRSSGTGGDVFVFKCDKPIDETTAVRKFKKVKQELAEGIL